MVSVRLGLIFTLVDHKKTFWDLCCFLYISTIYRMVLKINASCLLMTHLFFSVVHDINTSANYLNHDLEKISEWAFQWKMKFNQDPTKQAQDNIQQEKDCFYSPTCLFQ